MEPTTAKLQNEIKNALDEGQIEAIKKLRRELGEHLAAGANPCPNCGYDPVGMIKTPSYEKDGLTVPAVIEVGCVICPPFYVEAEGGAEKTLDGKPATVKRRSYSARAYSQAEAAAKWNAQEFVEDLRFGLNTTPEEEARLS
jgi:hypothetical protein